MIHLIRSYEKDTDHPSLSIPFPVEPPPRCPPASSATSRPLAGLGRPAGPATPRGRASWWRPAPATLSCPTLHRYRTRDIKEEFMMLTIILQTTAHRGGMQLWRSPDTTNATATSAASTTALSAALLSRAAKGRLWRGARPRRQRQHNLRLEQS